MFIRSSTAVNDCLIALNLVESIAKGDDNKSLGLAIKSNSCFTFYWRYESQEARDKAFEELCAFLNTNYKLRDFA